MEPQTLKMTRLEFYEMVWSTPTAKLARQFGLSDIGLSKVRHKHGIPKLPLGYWQRLEAGQKVPRTPLPPLKDARLETVYINKHLMAPLPPENEIFSEILELIKKERELGRRIRVPGRLIQTH